MRELKTDGVKNPNAEEYNALFPDFGEKEDENAAEVAAYETNIAEEFDMEKNLKLVTAALKRIEDGSYGMCQ